MEFTKVEVCRVRFTKVGAIELSLRLKYLNLFGIWYLVLVI
jgi:hypothetical protein